MWSAIGGSRFAFNHLLGLVKDNGTQVSAEKEASAAGETHATEYVSTNHFGLLYLWADARGEAAPWWAENPAQASMRTLARRLENGSAKVTTVQRSDPQPRRGGRVVGIDVGLTTLFTGVTTSGQQVLAGRARGVAPSNRWRRANARVRKCDARVANQRRNLPHNTTTRLVKDCGQVEAKLSLTERTGLLRLL